MVRTLNPGATPLYSVSELPLKLARKCVDVMGTGFDEDSEMHTLNTGCDDEVTNVTAGKDFCLIRTNSGKVRFLKLTMVLTNGFKLLSSFFHFFPAL